MTDSTHPVFPVREYPPEARDQKLLGLYDQRQPGMVLQRVRVAGGRLSPRQLRSLATIAGTFSRRPSLHLTTRQGIEIHGLSPEQIPVIQRALSEAGLTSLGAAGDTVRNSTVDPLGGMVSGTWDLFELAQFIDRELARLDLIWTLPRKFKISFSSDERATMRPYFSDLGFIARPDGMLTAVVAGSLGAHPGAGVPYPELLDSDDAVALVIAAVRLHHEAGDREHRNRARLRHILERVGVDAFFGRLGELFAHERSTRHDAAPRPNPTLANSSASHLRLGVPNGDLPLNVALELADAIESCGGELRIGIEHDLHLFNVPSSIVSRRAREWSSGGRIIACPGTTLCSKAAGPTHEAASALAPVARQHPDTLFAISGCPNSCSHAAAAAVGVVTRMKREGELRTPSYRIYLGGQNGGGPGLAELVAQDVSLDELTATVRSLLEPPPPTEDH